jgi:hypothetical protein
MAPDKGRRPEQRDDLLDWFTVTYKSIYIAVGVLVLAAVGGAVYYLRHQAPEQGLESPAPAVTTARFTSIDGNVKVKAVGTFEWVTADRSMVLQKSDVVRTGAGAAAEITFFDGTVVHLRPDSLVTIEESAGFPSAKERKVAFHISSGKADFQTPVRKPSGSSAAEITTSTATTTAGADTNGGILVAESGLTEVKLFRGTGQVETKAGQKVPLSTNEGIRVDATGKAGPKVTLPGVPTLLAPPHQAEISYMDPSRSTTLLAWKPASGATSYHLMVDYSAYFNRPIVDRKGIKDSSQQLRGLDVGKYYWRVAAADKDDVEGDFSAFARFTVTRPPGASQGNGPPPPLIVDPLDVRSNIVQVKGRTEPGASLTVNGQRVDVQEDGYFNEFVTLSEPGRQMVVIRAIGINGGVSEQKRPVVVAY